MTFTRTFSFNIEAEEAYLSPYSLDLMTTNSFYYLEMMYQHFCGHLSGNRSKARPYHGEKQDQPSTKLVLANTHGNV